MTYEKIYYSSPELAQMFINRQIAYAETEMEAKKRRKQMKVIKTEVWRDKQEEREVLINKLLK